MITIQLARPDSGSGQIGNRFKPSDLGFSLERTNDGFILWANHFALARVAEDQFDEMVNWGHAKNSRTFTATMISQYNWSYQKLGGRFIYRCTPVMRDGLLWLEKESEDKLDLLLLVEATDPKSAQYTDGAYNLVERTNGNTSWNLIVLPKGGAVRYSDRVYDYQSIAAKYLL